MKNYFIISMILLTGLLSACNPQALQTIGSDKYYVQVDGNAEEVGEQDHTRYEYTLEGFDKDGQSKNLTFTANHELKEDAYLLIYYKNDEVITYEEKDSDEIPEKAQQNLEGE